MVQLYLELGYFAAVNLVAFALMGIDKQRAKKHLWRIPEKTLFLAVILGGGIGGTAGMFFFIPLPRLSVVTFSLRYRVSDFVGGHLTGIMIAAKAGLGEVRSVPHLGPFWGF